MRDLLDLLALTRPKHWLKNSFVLAGVAVAYILVENASTPDVLEILLGLALVCLASSVNYVLNEALDASFDRHHPEKHLRSVATGKTSQKSAFSLYFICLILCIICGTWFSKGFLWSMLALLVSGILYNTPPIRVKNISYLDAAFEALNSPIRVLLGWYLVAPSTSFPPTSLLLSWWALGGLLMTGKRHAELVRINDPGRAALYRKALKGYTKEKTMLLMVMYSNIAFFSLGVLFSVYARFHNLVFIMPVLLGVLSLYICKALGSRAVELEPETLLIHRQGLIGVVGLSMLTAILLMIPIDLTQYLRLFMPAY